MAVSEATMREWATPVPEDQWNSLRYPTNNKSDAELIARTLRGEESSKLYDLFNQKLTALQIPCATGIFGANMKVSITNDGPATFMLESRS